MLNILMKILCVSLIFFCKISIYMIEKFKEYIDNCKQFFTRSFTIIYHFGEDPYITTKRKNLKIPYNIGVILNNQKYENISFHLIQLINWSMKIGINYLNLYDPFNVLKGSNMEHFKNLMTLIYSKKINFEKSNSKDSSNREDLLREIVITWGKKIYNVNLCKLFEIKNSCLIEIKENVRQSDFYSGQPAVYDDGDTNLFFEMLKSNKKAFFTIKLINFKEANLDLFKLDNIRNYELDASLGLINYELFESKEGSTDKLSNQGIMKKIDRRLLTKKEVNYLPEILLNFSQTELCLYGFPFTIMENCEIINGGDLTKFNITKFVKILEKYTKIDKRFGK